MTLEQFMERFDGSRFRTMRCGGTYVLIRTRDTKCCPIEQVSGVGKNQTIRGADALGLSPYDRGVIMSAADCRLESLNPDGAAYRLRRAMLAKMRQARKR